MAQNQKSTRSLNFGIKWMLLICLICGMSLITLSCMGFTDLFQRMTEIGLLKDNTSRVHRSEALDPPTTPQSQYVAQTDRPDKVLPQNCSHEIFRKFYAENNQFPGAGRWVEERNTTNYHPDICLLQNNIDPDGISRCFLNKNFSDVLVMGDSYGYRYFLAVVRFIEMLGATCDFHSGEKVSNKTRFTPDKDYYSRSLQNYSIPGRLVVGRRTCTTCSGGVYVCKKYADPPFEVTVRRLANSMIFDSSIQIKDGEKVVIKTAQEFYFRILLKDKYPDILLYFAPLHHMKFKAMKGLRHTVKVLHQLMDKYIPRRTKIFFIPSHGEFESVRKAVAFKFRKFEGYLADEKIRLLGRLMFDELKPALINDSRIYGFFDTWALGSSRVSWCQEGIHMKPIWYDKIIAMFFEIFCNSNNT